jgi:phosphatidylserine synthase
MHKIKDPWRIFFVYSSFVAVLAMLIVGGMLLSPSEAGNALFLGLSLPRLILSSGLTATFLFFAFLSIKAFKDRTWAERIFERSFGESRISKVITWLAVFSFGFGWIGCFLPAYRAGILAIHWARIQPAMVFILLAGLATLTMIFVKRINFTVQDLKFSKTFGLSLVLFLLSILLIGIMLYSGFGVSAAEDYWYGAGVPILVSQLIAAIAGGIFFLQIESRWSSKRSDLIIFLLIYAVTAILWAREPLQKSFLFIGPYPPNRVLYPFADAALFDTASQFALIGQDFLFFNGLFFERALYISFLVYLHSLIGQDYGQLMAAQAALFAVFPALVYLVGRSLNTRAVGFAAAIIATLRGINSIAASNMIDMANPKMMLTDFPTAIGMVLIVLLTCEWLKKPPQKWHYVIWIGGIIGLTIMLRTNTLMLLLLIPFYAILKFLPEWRPWLVSSFLLILAAFAVTLPWELRNQSLGGQIYSSIFAKFQDVIQQRYIPPSEPESFLPREQTLSLVSFQQLQALTILRPEVSIAQTAKPCDQVTCFVSNHFLHNILTSILIFPTSPVLDDLRHTVRESFPYWDPRWDGKFTIPTLLFFVLNIFFITLGISVAWKQWRLVGLAPLVLFIFYDLSNGLARTSGGRYIVPIDWIVTIYFLIGVFQVIVVCAYGLGFRGPLFTDPIEHNTPKQSFRANDLARIGVTLAILFGVGTLVPLAEHLHEKHFDNFEISEVLKERESQISNAGLSLQEIDSFLKYPNAEILVGRALYPRYYIENEGEVHFYPVVTMGFPRTTFTLIGPQGERGIVLPGKKPRYFPHGADTIVIGCKEQLYVDALAVIILDEKGAIYTRSPASSLGCPLKQPVCDNNHNCN